MTNEVCVFIYLPLLIISILLLSAMAVKREKLYTDRMYILLTLVLIGWQVMELLFYILPDPLWIKFVFDAKFVFISFVPVLFMFLVAGFYHLSKKIRLWMKLALVAVPAVTAVITATSVWHDLFRTRFEVLSTEPLTRVAFEWGPWYPVHLIFSQIPVLIIGIVFFTQYRKLPGAYRTVVNLLIIGMLVYVMGFALEVLHLDQHNTLDFNLIAICLSNFIFYVSVSSSGRADYLNVWRRDIFDTLDEGVLVVNEMGIVVEANASALQIFRGLAGVIEGSALEDLMGEVAASEQASIRTSEGIKGKDLYITSGKYPVIYNMRRQPIPETSRAGRGEFVTFSEVTGNRLLIERLQETAGIDALTGLRNRFGYEQALREADTLDNLPLSIIISDVNGLKKLNDTHGHDAGDLLLKKVAELMNRCLPQGTIVARIGGDEFVALLKNCSLTGAQGSIDALHRAVQALHDFPHPVSIALGCATKTRPDENINLLFRQADERMYIDKVSGGGAR